MTEKGNENSNISDQEYNYWLANLKNIGIKKIDFLLQYFTNSRELFQASREDLMRVREAGINKVRFTEADVEHICQNRNTDIIRKNYAKLEKNGIYFVSKEDVCYPDKLRHIYGSPFALYIKGSLPATDEKLLAIVGARDCSDYGREMARYFAAEAAKQGIGIISGLARGVDSYAHEGAFRHGGKTYGVLGCGIDICYPKENINLYREIMMEGGIISEYAPGVAPLAGNFPMRNRIISGLCDAILVIEAREKSGSLITVDMGLEQGKEIYTLPGRVTDALSCGCNNLIKMGAKLVTSPKDILEDFIPNYNAKANDFKKNNKFLESDGKIVYACLSLQPMHVEQIAMQTKLPVDLLMEQLLFLELAGFIKQTRTNYYIIQV